MAMWGEDVDGAITSAASRYGLAPELLRTFAKIESSGRPNAQTGSYKGLFQLSNSEFGKHGGGDIFNPVDNANAAAQKLARESAAFKTKYGRDPSPSDLYMIHQQGEGGYGAHVANPNAPAWQNMASTLEGRQKGAGWAKQAIWGNVPSDVRSQYPGGVDSLTSQQFLDLWNSKVNRMGAGTADMNRNPYIDPMNPHSGGFARPAPIGSTVAGGAPAGGPAPMPVEALQAPSGRYSKLAEALMMKAAGAKPGGWGEALNALGSAALGYTLGDKEEKAQQQYQSKLSQMLAGATTPEALSQTLIQSGDPDLVKQGIGVRIAQAKPKSEIGRFRPTKQGVVDTTTGQIVPGTEQKGTDNAEYGTSTKAFEDKDGSIQYMQFSKAGGGQPVKLPEGARWRPDVEIKDIGTGFVPVSKQTGQVVGSPIAKDILGKESQEEIGKLAGQARVSLPAAKTALDNARQTIAGLRSHPGIDAATGLSNWTDPRSWTAGTDAFDFLQKNQQATGQSFMIARDALKGAGQVTDFEGAKGEQAIANLNAAQSKKQYLEALDTLERMMDSSYRDLETKANAGAPASAAAPSAPDVNALKQKYGLD